MGKWAGILGFREPTEISPGIIDDVITELRVRGDLLSDNYRTSSSDQTERDFTIRKRISIIMSPYIQEHYSSISHISCMNALWKVTSVDVQYPRIILETGGVYNGPRPNSIPTNSPSVT